MSDGESVLALHASDESFHAPLRPDLVVHATGVDDVVAVLAAAQTHGVPVVPFGAGSSMEGHVIPLAGGVSLDLSRMNRILAIRPEELSATVEPGVTRLQLGARAGERGLMFPVDPGADATLGGMAATNAAGTTTVRYGKTRAQVLELKAVLPGGRTIRTGTRAAKTSAGYDLTGLLVGSEGTLGVIVELTVRLHPIAEATIAIGLSPPTLAAAGELAQAIVAAGIPVTRLELLDEWEVTALNRLGDAELPAGALILVELSGSEAAVERELLDLEGVVADLRGPDLVVERAHARQRALWSLRHRVVVAEQVMAPGRRCRSTDVCVPLSALPETLVASRAAMDELGLTGGIASHAGDGNVHVVLMLDPDDRDELRRADELVDRLVDDALARGGTCTGEHGIGCGKLDALRREHGDSVDLMRAIKAAFDPQGIMNPGKVLPALNPTHDAGT